MKQNTLFFLWGGLYVLCAGLGFVPEPTGVVRFAMVCLSLLFFLPPATALYQAVKAGRREVPVLIRNLSAIWLMATTAILVCNFLSLWGSEFTGDFLYALLVMVSSPMICGQSWIVTIFAWACLLFSSIHILKTMNTRT